MDGLSCLFISFRGFCALCTSEEYAAVIKTNKVYTYRNVYPVFEIETLCQPKPKRYADQTNRYSDLANVFAAQNQYRLHPNRPE